MTLDVEVTPRSLTTEDGKMETYFFFLNRLRDSGSVNMFGAAVVLQEVFDVDRKEAQRILLEWMKQFED